MQQQRNSLVVAVPVLKDILLASVAGVAGEQ